MSHQLDIRASREAERSVVRLSGEIDLRTSPTLHARLLELVEARPKQLVIDLAGVSYVDSSGVGTLVDVKRQMEKRGGRVTLVGLQERVRSVLEITRLDTFFTIKASVDEAD